MLFRSGPIDQDDYVIEMCTGFPATDGKLLYVNDLVQFPLGIKTSKGKIIYEHFSFWIVEKQGGMLKFDQKNYKYIGNINVNPDVLNITEEEQNHKGGH